MQPRSLFAAAVVLAAGLTTGCDRATQAVPEASADASPAVPAWAADAVFYQIFPERFENADPSNDPTRASLEYPVERTPETWTVSDWTADWYAQAPWEREMGDFYEGVFRRRYGGDLQGVIDRLGYLDSLGVNAIYFNPVFWARSLHKYEANSFHHIDPYFGPDPEGDLAAIAAEDPSDPARWVWTAADSLFLDLVREARARGIRVVIDGVFNHTGRDFFAFADVRERQQDSPYKDWFIVNAFDDPATPEDEFDWEGWWGYKPLVLLADNADSTDLHPGPRQYFFDVTRRWMDPDGDGDPSDGIDGWRLDVAGEVPVGFWADWNAHVRSINPEAYTVTEIWEPAGDFVRDGGFSATMNYWAFALPVKGFLVDGALAPSAFAELLNERRELYPEAVQYALQNLIDSHDTQRLASMIVNARAEYEDANWFDYDRGERVSPRGGGDYDVSAPGARDQQVQRLVALFQMTYVGAPMLYYGTEAGMWGADDPDDRMPMVWPDRTYAPQSADPLGRPRMPDPVAFDHALFDYYRQAVALRNGSAALRRGAFEVLLADDAQDVFAYRRTLGDEAVVVVLNRGDAAAEVRLPLEDAAAYTRAFATPGDAPSFAADADGVTATLPPLAGLVLRRE